MKNKKIFVSVLIAIVLVISAIIFAGFFTFYNLTSPVEKSAENTNDVRIEITYGTSVKTISKMLKENNLIKNDTVFYICARKPQILNLFYKDYEKISNFTPKSGIYHLNGSMNIVELLNTLSSGQQEYIKISIPEGYTISKIGELLEKNGVCSLSDFKNSAKNPEILIEYKIPTDSCEGFLFPDTYYFNPQMNSNAVVKLMIDNFFEKISSLIDVNTISQEKLRDYVVLASIIEREYRLEEEAPVIASVFYNRLRHNIGLYSCATVEYIISEILERPHPERILIEDTRIDNPYNTYKWAGLPPGAISNPGLVALNASINPAKTNYYFFQVADESIGKHVFTESFDQHVSNHNLTLKK